MGNLRKKKTEEALGNLFCFGLGKIFKNFIQENLIQEISKKNVQEILRKTRKNGENLTKKFLKC